MDWRMMLLALMLALAACQPVQAPTVMQRNDANEPTVPHGQLAYIGGDGNVYVAFR